jgi:hypothetical protein
VNYTLAFALQLRKKHGKTSVRVAEEIMMMMMMMMIIIIIIIIIM